MILLPLPPPLSPAPKVVRTKPQNVPESVSEPVEVVDSIVESEVEEEPETPLGGGAQTVVEGVEPDVIENGSEPDIDDIADDRVPNVHEEL